MSDNGVSSPSSATLFFRANNLAADTLSLNQAEKKVSPNEVELEKTLKKSAFKEAKKQWKALLSDIEPA